MSVVSVHKKPTTVSVVVKVDEYGTIRTLSGRRIGEMVAIEDEPDTYTLALDGGRECNEGGVMVYLRKEHRSPLQGGNYEVWACSVHGTVHIPTLD